MSTINPMPVPTWKHLGVNEASHTAPWSSWNSAAPILWEIPEGISSQSETPSLPLTGALGSDFEAAVHLSRSVHHIFLDKNSMNPVLLSAKVDHETESSILEVEVAPDTSATVYVLLQGSGQAGCTVHLSLHKNAALHWVELHTMEKESDVYTSIASNLEEDAKLEVTRVETGCHTVFSGTRASLKGNSSQFTLHALYLGMEDQILDFNDIAEHDGANTSSLMYTAGILDDKASKILRGTIDFRRGSVHGTGRESEDVLLFSPDVRNRTAPIILCSEEQVDGQHAASIGKMNPEELYYCQSRGMDEDTARKLLASARMRPVIDSIPDPALRQQILEVIEKRLEKHARPAL